MYVKILLLDSLIIYPYFYVKCLRYYYDKVEIKLFVQFIYTHLIAEFTFKFIFNR
jgi:hypothetical protein